MLNQLCDDAHANAVEKGFYERKRELPELLMLVVSELSEAMEADRAGESKLTMAELNEIARVTADGGDEFYVDDYVAFVRGTVPEEIADAFIRLFDLCGYYGIDIDAHIAAKMKYNATRPRKHGKRY